MPTQPAKLYKLMDTYMIFLNYLLLIYLSFKILSHHLLTSHFVKLQPAKVKRLLYYLNKINNAIDTQVLYLINFIRLTQSYER
jgi:hypothetical protein